VYQPLQKHQQRKKPPIPTEQKPFVPVRTEAGITAGKKKLGASTAIVTCIPRACTGHKAKMKMFCTDRCRHCCD